jgi:nickel/cobalt exporter
MSVKKSGALWLAVGASAICLLLVAGVANDVLAQTGPLGVPRPSTPAAPPDGIVGWLLAKQAEFYRAMSGTIRAAKADGSALYTLFGISFLYGIFHAAGPGHGKAVISSYLVANEETWRRGVILSFASAFLQALVAVLIVGIAAALLGATAKVMGDAVRYIEIASYALIAFLGARLLWVKGRGFISAWKGVETAHDHGHSHEHAHHQAHTHDHHHGHDHHHYDHSDDRDHVHDEHCGHSHGPEPAELAGPGGWKRGLSAIVAVGLRPCSGAILVLVFALAQGLFWAGVAATFIMGLGTAITVAAIATLAVGAKALARRLATSHSGKGALFLRGIEVAAAALVLVFGLALLAGYMVSERMFT